MVCDIPLEAIHDCACVVKERADVRRGYIRARACEVDTVPANELVFSTMIVVVL